ncbi:MAG TPA: T9SS type A sorting domain-containing protein, partial [Candidatus Kapabacteria bacterium]|nr:T9SS type A sorting domain-containing protein [Candidatus Kapabacteria bacterium]
AKQVVQLDFGTFKTEVPDEYKAVLTVDLRSAADLEPYNDQYRRQDEPAYTFEVRDEIQAKANAILYPLSSSEIIAGRPFIPSVEIKNEGVGDITNCPTTITVTEEPSGKVVFTQTMLVQDIPSGRYNLKTVYFDPKTISKPGTYKITFKVNHPDDLVSEDNETSLIFTVSGGFVGNYTIGNKNSSQPNNFTTIGKALDELYFRGMNGSVTLELTDDEYNVDSKNNFAPALDLSTAIMGLGYNAETGTYNTLTIKPSLDKAVSKGSIKINLNSTNGIGVFMGQAIRNSNFNSVQGDNFGRATFIKYSNNGGYITIDGGANSSLKFVINSQRPSFAAAFYMNGGSSNNTIKNVIIENGTPSTANAVSLPNVVFSVVDGFRFTDDEYITETGYKGYSAGIVNRAKLLALNTQDIVVALDTLPNKNNKFTNNEISGFAYGIVSYGIGPLRVPELQDYRPFYNENTLIANNKIYNVTAAGIVVGHEHNSKVNNNTIFDINGNAGDISSGIIAGGNSSLGVQGYNNMNLKIDGNKISNVRGKTSVYGILVDQDLNKYPVGSKFALFPDRNDDISVTNNAIFDIKASSSNAMRVGISVTSERNKEIADGLARLISPRYTDIFIKDLMVANNTVLLSEDGVTNNNQFVGIGIQQAYKGVLKNNAISITDATISSNNEASTGVFYQGAYPYEDGGLIADRNAFWLQNANVSAYRHIYTDYKNKIVELGSRNEYHSLEQWQMASKSELNSVANGNFSNDYYTMGTYPAELQVKSTVKGSVLSKRGDRMKEYGLDVNGVIRGQAGSRYDIGAVEFNGSLYNRDAEMLVMTEPGSYRSTTGIFSDAEYLMTEAPIAVKAIVRNSGSLQVTDKKFTVNIYRQDFVGNWVQELGPIDASEDIEATEHALIDFKLADGVGSEFIPKTYNDLRSEYTTIPEQFKGMEPNVTPLYKIVITVGSDEYNSNNSIEKTLRFYLRRSSVKVLVSNNNYVDLTTAVSSNDLASGLNEAAVEKGMDLIGWKIDLENGRYDYDVFERAGWEPRNVDYRHYRSLYWSDGDENTLSRLQKLDLTNFVNAGSVSEKKNLIIMSQELVRNNTNIDDADEVFLKDVIRAEYRFPGNPLGNGQNYDGKSVTGVNLARDKQFDIISTGVAGDSYPMPALMNIVEGGEGLSKMAIRYNSTQNNEWPDAARIGGVGTTTLQSNVLYVGIDWRHFGDVEGVLRGTFDFAEGNGGIVVPVELMSFDATAIGQRVELNWRTASEQNSSRFEVERADVTASGTSSYVKIDEVPAAGNSSIISNYGPIIDNGVHYGNTYNYRLKMIDLDGKFDYSDVKTVTLGGTEGKAWLASVKPNPVNSSSILEYGLGEGMTIEINIYDASGKLVKNLYSGMQTVGSHSLNLGANNLSSGSYTIVMNVGETILTQTITVVK